MQREVDTNPQLASTLKMPVGDYLRRLYFDTICFEPAILRYAAEIVPVEHLLLGSDAPFPLGEPNPVTFVKNALPADQAELILNRNFDSPDGSVMMDIRRLVLIIATWSIAEGGLLAMAPVSRAAACAVIANPLAGRRRTTSAN